MYRLWDFVLQPLLEASEPTVIIEIGSRSGDTTKRLVDSARQLGAHVHAIDPVPRFDPLELDPTGEILTLHVGTSLEVLHGCPAASLVLIDGDHNHYTVLRELRTIADRSRAAGRVFPVVALHDTSWPYARRDVYDDPQRVPEQHRQPFRHGGLVCGQNELSGNDGLSPQFQHARSEGGPRNGVLTAVEDFLSEVDLDIEARSFDALHGFTILADQRQLEGNPRLRDELDRWRVDSQVAKLVQLLEHERVVYLTRVQELERRQAASNPLVPVGDWSTNAVPDLTPEEQGIVDRFHHLYYEKWRQENFPTVSVGWFGHHTFKCPLDLWIYQEILVETRPDVIIETGTRFGGSAVFLASLCRLLGHGRVITIDIDDTTPRPEHDLVTYITGSSTEAATVEQVRAAVGDAQRCMVILDSDHRAEHVLRELQIYSEWVTKGCYLIAEDTNINGNPVFPDYGDPGPAEAVDSFLATNADFVVDRSRERFLLTLHPGGFLRRVGP